MSTEIYGTPKADLSKEDGMLDPLTKKDILFSFRGRIGRMEYWMATLAILGAMVLFVLLVSMLQLGEAISGLLTLVIYVPVLWASFAVQAKRWHDRNKSAWWILITFIPVIGAIWALVENGFLSGTDGPNNFGYSTNSR